MATKCPKCQFDNTDTAHFCSNCASPLANPEDIVASKTMTIRQPTQKISNGDILARKYRIIEPIGKGGMGVVYKAEDIKLERTVALKFLPAELTEDPEARERFVREAKAAAALSHSHICTIHEIGEEDNQYFIAMECIEGQSLKQKILKGPIDQAEALDIAIQVAEGLEEAHKKGIIHRDIKPGNIMVTDKSQAKVMDFGLAKVSGASLITKEAKTMGTIAYMSPEQAQGQSVDHRTDVWSLGVVLYEMLTGQLPFRGEYDQSIIHSILRREPEPLTKALPNIMKGLENVVLTALAKNPTGRYQSMEEFLDDLKTLAEGLKPIRARARLFRGKILGLRRVYFFVGLIILAALIGLGLLMINPGRSEALDSVAILPLVNDSGDPSQDYFANSLTEIMITELYKVAALSVAPRQAVIPYKNSNKSPREIADELNVKAIVEGSVFKSGDRIRLTARLIDPYRNRIIWSAALEKSYSEILILQSELSQAIVTGIKVAITPEEKTRLAADRKVNPEAYDLVMQGIQFWLYIGSSEMSQQDIHWKAIDYFQRAIDLDPTLALAHAWKAHIYSVLGIQGREDEREVYPKAREAVFKALELDGNLAQAHATLAIIKLYQEWDFAGAEVENRRALELEPGNEYMWFSYEQILITVGRGDEAMSMYKRYIEQQEIAQSKVLHARFKATHYLWLGRYEEALVEFKNRIMSSTGPHFVDFAVAYALNGMYSEALAQIDKIKHLPAMQEDILFRLNYAWILAVSGSREESLKELEKLKSLLTQMNIDPTYYTACVYAGLGDKDKAFEYLNQAYQNHSTLMINLISDWWLHNLHGDPRFEDLRKKVGFPDLPAAGKR